MADIKVYGTLKNATQSGKIAYAEQVFDTGQNKMQSEINEIAVSSGQIRKKVCFWNIGLFSLGQTADPSITPATLDEMRAKWRSMMNETAPDLMLCCEYNNLFMKAQGGQSAVTSRDAVFNPSIFPFAEIGPTVSNVAMKTAIFSTEELDESETIFFDQTNQADRYFQVSGVNMNGKSVKVVSTHLDFIPSESTPEEKEAIHQIRLSQINQLIDQFDLDDYVIICADFNTNLDDSYLSDYDLFTDAGYNMANCGYMGILRTYPAGETPTRALDNIVCKGFSIGKVGIFNDETMSDHCSIFADLTMVV